VPLLLFRIGLDRLIRRAPLMPSWIDRAGGGLFGLLSAMVMMGVAGSSLQLLPFEKTCLGYSRINVPSMEKPDDGPNPKPPDIAAPERELWFRPDRFAASLAYTLSDGIFSGSRSLREENPDIVQSIGWLSAVPCEVTRYAAPDSIRIVRTERLPLVYRHTPGEQGAGRRRITGEDAPTRTVDESATYEPLPPPTGREYRMIRVKLMPDARSEWNSHVFSLRQFRLVGLEGANGPRKQYFPIAIQQYLERGQTSAINRHVREVKTKWGDWPVTDNLYSPRDDNQDEVEIVFELPPDMIPEFLEYKRGARAAVVFEKGGKPLDSSRESPSVPPTPTESAPPAAPSPGEAASDSGRGGNVRRMTAKRGQSGFGPDMPITLTSYRKLNNVDLGRGALIDGHLLGYMDEQEGGKDEPVSKFEVPSDKRLLQLHTSVLQARSGLGRALSFAVGTIQNYFVEAADGNRYEIVGKYAIAEVEGRQVIEVQYFSNKAGTVGGLGKFNKIKEDKLEGDYEFVLLFLVDPGAEITAFSTGGAASRRDELTGEGLVAPE